MFTWDCVSPEDRKIIERIAPAFPYSAADVASELANVRQNISLNEEDVTKELEIKLENRMWQGY